MTILVTGGAGFIGANFVLHWLSGSEELVVNLDKLTYAGNLQALEAVRDSPSHVFVHGDIGDRILVNYLLDQYQPRAILNFAAESHIDRSIVGPAAFIETNVMATFHLLEAVKCYWQTLHADRRVEFRLLHVSTDEVYGTLATDDAPFTERHAYAPNNPYSASKAASDHLFRAWHHTYGLPVLTTHCSNNYGPYHFPEKLIPLIITRALAGKYLPVYGDGQHVRDWLHVKDHCAALHIVLDRGQKGETYNIGGCNEKTNLEVVNTLCDILDILHPRIDGMSYQKQIIFLEDRPGHDRRYAIDARKLQRDLGWRPVETFETGIRSTVQWYLDNLEWVGKVTSAQHHARTAQHCAS